MATFPDPLSADAGRLSSYGFQQDTETACARSSALNLLFLDRLGFDFDASTPDRQPLGGSHSALCYLSAELARRGHRVAVVNGVPEEREAMGVRCLPLKSLATTDLLAAPWDAVVLLNGSANSALGLRPHLHEATAAVLWTQHAPDQPAMASLESAEVRNAWDALVFVSEWQRAAYFRQFSIDPSRSHVLRNAIAPAFEGMFSSPEDLVRAKTSHPVLAYTSTPYRGLELLVDLFPSIRNEYADAELHVYSSMKVYQWDEPRDEHGPLYERCRSIPGVRYQDSLGQNALARALRGLSVLSYPSTFAETSCIAVMEAMAAGACVVTTDLGALAETTMSFARLVPVARWMDLKLLGFLYLQHLRQVLEERRRDPAAFAAAHWDQVCAVNAKYTWSRRAAQWERAVAAWKRSHTV